MKTTIYYFTGSGNSLAIARKVAAGLEEAELVAIAKVFDQEMQVSSRRIGFVFPVYAYGLPRMVREFVQKIEMPAGAYIFGIASNCGIPGTTLRQLDRVLRKQGNRLQAGFSVLDERSSLINDPDNDAIQKLMISSNRSEFPEKSSRRIDEMVGTIAAEQSAPIESSNLLTNILGGVLNPLAAGSFKRMAAEFWTSENCSGCSSCVRVCPRGNIRLENGRPVWGEDCEMCHACIQWCPAAAIEFKDLTQSKPRYKCPGITLQEMLLR